MKTGTEKNTADMPSDGTALDRIDRYVLGNMEPEDCASFEAELSSDPELRNRLPSAVWLFLQ